MSEISTKSIKNLLEKKYIFYVPSYQRGYRWGKQQVVDLVKDISEFIETNKENNNIYCLQPLVVQLKDNKYHVIDGQQRLTTLYILIACIKRNNIVDFSIEYETREKSMKFLEKINDKSANEGLDNIDYYNMVNTRDYIKNALKDLPEEQKKNDYEIFRSALYDRVKFIWYQLDIKQDPIQVFKRLNIDKIALTASELIKAILLSRTNFDSDVKSKQIEIASEWDNFERKLQNDEFWYFFHGEGYEKPTRIDYIFSMLCNLDLLNLGCKREEYGDDDYYFYRYIEIFFKQHGHSRKSLDMVWNEVKSIFNTLEDWYNTPLFYHYIGFLFSVGIPSEGSSQRLLNELIKEWNKEKTRDRFKNKLIERINEKISACNDLDEEYKDKRICKPLLLLHNIQTVINQSANIKNEYGQRNFTRFPFNLYKIEKWDVEHIDSSTENDLSEPKQQIEWLLTNYFSADEATQKDIENFCIKTEGKEYKNTYKDFEILKKRIEPNIAHKDRLSDKEKNKIFNYTLLDSNTNRSYGNAIFPTKRRVIIGKGQGSFYDKPKFKPKDDTHDGYIDIGESVKANSSFIMPCTNYIFMKYYSPLSSSTIAWTRMDALAYRKNIIKVLSPLFNLKFTEHE